MFSSVNGSPEKYNSSRAQTGIPASCYDKADPGNSSIMITLLLRLEYCYVLLCARVPVVQMITQSD